MTKSANNFSQNIRHPTYEKNVKNSDLSIILIKLVMEARLTYSHGD